MPTLRRTTGWLNDAFHLRFREHMLHAAAREGLLCPAYCLMPDHIHLVWMGLRPSTDQRNAMAFLRTLLEPGLKTTAFQHQAHDHIMRPEERRRSHFASTCTYILNNPVEAGLVENATEWPYHGCVVPGYPKLHPLEPGYWGKLWRIHMKLLNPEP